MLKADAQTIKCRLFNQALLTLVRLLLAFIVGSVGLLLIYAFGAGYLSNYGLLLPKPWHFLASGLLVAGLVAALMRILLGPMARQKRGAGRGNTRL